MRAGRILLRVHDPFVWKPGKVREVPVRTRYDYGPVRPLQVATLKRRRSATQVIANVGEALPVRRPVQRVEAFGVAEREDLLRVVSLGCPSSRFRDRNARSGQW